VPRCLWHCQCRPVSPALLLAAHYVNAATQGRGIAPFPLSSISTAYKRLVLAHGRTTRNHRCPPLLLLNHPTPSSPLRPLFPRADPKIACPQPLEAPPPVPHRPRSPELAGAPLPPLVSYCHRRRPSSGHTGVNRAHPKVALVSLMLPHLSLASGKHPIAGIEHPELSLFQKLRPGTPYNNRKNSRGLLKASRPLIRVLVINDNGLWINNSF
jgi:hypothetical protein